MGMERVDYLPIGTVVRMKGAVKDSMIIARGIGTIINGETQLFDYGGCLYPEGLMGQTILYFNHCDIEKIVFTGYDSEENKILAKGINDVLEKSNMKKGNPYDLNVQNLQKYGKKD